MFEIMPYNYRRIANYNPFRELDEMSRRFWSGTEMTEFRTDITEKDGTYVLEAELPGFKKEDISIDLDKDCLTITASRKSESDDEDEERNYVRRERFYGSYSRSFNVSGINTDEISASYNDGILSVSMPKKEPEIPAARRLEIQ